VDRRKKDTMFLNMVCIFQQRAGKTTEMLEGQIDFGKNSISPDFTYKVVNRTLQTDPHSPILNLQAKRG